MSRRIMGKASFVEIKDFSLKIVGDVPLSQVLKNAFQILLIGQYLINGKRFHNDLITVII